MRMTDINRALAKAGAPVTLSWGHGSVDFTFENGRDRCSYPGCWFDRMSDDWWLGEGLRFAAEVRAQREARFADLMEYDPDKDDEL